MTELDVRHREILKAIVEDHIASGDPVGSQQIARRAEVDVSAATIRAVMADLESLGYLEKPHTSAGRIPTDQGYRFFVDGLVKLPPPPSSERQTIDVAVESMVGTLEDRLGQASRLLHDLCRHACVLVGPDSSSGRFQHVEFVRLRDDRALAVLVSQEGAVQNRLLRLDQPWSQAQLTEAANFLNALLGELSLEQARDRIVSDLADQKARYDTFVHNALSLGQEALKVESDPHDARLLVEGRTSLLQHFAQDMEQARAALTLLEERKRLLSVLDLTRAAGQLQIFIGTESGFTPGGVAVVASPFGEGGVVGSLGVIGPTRMNYPKVISLVGYTARALSRSLGG